MEVDILKPTLREPFPNMPEIWVCPKTGLKVPKDMMKNIEWRAKLLDRAENDPILQRDLLAACGESQIFWVNAFAWTYHQFDVDPETGKTIDAKVPYAPFITWEVQDRLCNRFEQCLKLAEDLLIDKSRDMGASWECVNFMHWIWLFKPGKQLLEMSRTQDYVDQTGNMKALFQKHDVVNGWLPKWMLPPNVLFGQKNRTKMHMMNAINGSCIDGESTTENAASGDRRYVTLLDEFAKVEHGQLMRSATRPASYVRIINSTPAGAGTEYSRWKNSGQIKVFILPFYEHPGKGAGRYIKQTDTGKYEIRSPWFDHEETVCSPQEMAREVLRQDIESGAVFFTIHNIDKHIALFAREPRGRYHIHFKPNTSNDRVNKLICGKKLESVVVTKGSKGPLKVWTTLIMDRPDQAKTYIFGIDIGTGQGASDSVISVKCKETGEKIAEWRSNTTPPYDMARITVALAIWVGGRNPRKLPFLKWEKNGPGLDYGRLIVKVFRYPYYYRTKKIGQITEQITKEYGWHASNPSKRELLSLYDRMLAHGGYINHSIEGLKQAKEYINYNGGGIGPAKLVEKSDSEKKTHGDIVMADALTLEDSDLPKTKYKGASAPMNSCGYRRDKIMRKRKAAKNSKSWRKPYNFEKVV